MKKLSVSLSFIVIIMAIGVVFIVNMDNTTEEETLLIGMSQANLFEPWRISMNDEIKEAAKSYGNIKVIIKDAAGDSDKQKQDIEDLLKFGVDLLIVSINDSEELSASVKSAYEKIPVILLDRAVEGVDYTLYIGTDNESIGMQAGELIASIFNNKKAHIVEIEGLLNSNPDEERSDGFASAISKYDNIQLEWKVVASWQKDKAEDTLKEILMKDSSINAIFAHSDYMALGAYKAVKSLGLDDVVIIGADGLQGENGGIKLVDKGILQGTFTCPTGGKEAIENAVKILRNEEVPQKIILKCQMITSENISYFRP